MFVGETHDLLDESGSLVIGWGSLLWRLRNGEWWWWRVVVSVWSDDLCRDRGWYWLWWWDWWSCCYWWGGLNDLSENRSVDEVHDKEGLEDSVGELGGLSKEFDGAVRVCGHKLLHLDEKVVKLSWREGAEGTGDGIEGGASWGKWYSGWEWWKTALSS